MYWGRQMCGEGVSNAEVNIWKSAKWTEPVKLFAFFNYDIIISEVTLSFSSLFILNIFSDISMKNSENLVAEHHPLKLIMYAFAFDQFLKRSLVFFNS